ncbi:Trichothecene 3-O-acetyltransferase [Colletotrichum sp. SAR11_240]|nr:Trichothecene 3-O-acetyltransferase [Colletotrichum sp. SAR11_240]
MDEPVEGQQSGLNIYTQIAVCFAVDDDSVYPKITAILEDGLKRLAENFPWIAGQVVNEGASEGNTGVFKIRPLKETPPLVIKDLRSDSSAPTMQGLKGANFPFRMLDESVVAPRPTLPIDPALASEPEPVFITQATFIRGGLVLTFLGQHQTLDGIGQTQIIHLLSKACRDEPFTAEEITTGNMPKHNIIPLFDHDIPDSEVAAFRKTEPVGRAPADPPKCGWAYFNFPASSLSSLKSLAMKTIKSGFVSTDDAVTAFIWQSVSRIRASRVNHEEEVRSARAIDIRKFLNVPQTFPGLCQSMTYNSFNLKKLIDAPLGEVASAFRSSADPQMVVNKFRAFATVLDRSADKSVFSFTGSSEPYKDIFFSSWVKMDLYKNDFGLGLGKPECVKRPQFTPVESLMYLMPKTPNGDVALAICLREEDMEKLRADETFTKYATYTP